MPPLLVSGPEFERGNHFAVLLELVCWEHPWHALIHPLHRTRSGTMPQRPVDRRFRDIISRSGLPNHLACRGTVGGQGAESTAQIDQPLRRQGFGFHPLAPRGGGGRGPTPPPCQPIIEGRFGTFQEL